MLPGNATTVRRLLCGPSQCIDLPVLARSLQSSLCKQAKPRHAETVLPVSYLPMALLRVRSAQVCHGVNETGAVSFECGLLRKGFVGAEGIAQRSERSGARRSPVPAKPGFAQVLPWRLQRSPIVRVRNSANRPGRRPDGGDVVDGGGAPAAGRRPKLVRGTQTNRYESFAFERGVGAVGFRRGVTAQIAG